MSFREREVISHHLPKAESGAQLSETAKRYFITASARFPASVNCQAAQIALFAQDSSHEVRGLEQALLSDRSQIREIIEKAKRAHRHSSYAPRRIPFMKAIEIISSDFQRAQTFSHLETPDLVGICQLYRRGLHDDYIEREVTRRFPNLPYKEERYMSYLRMLLKTLTIR